MAYTAEQIASARLRAAKGNLESFRQALKAQGFMSFGYRLDILRGDSEEASNVTEPTIVRTVMMWPAAEFQFADEAWQTLASYVGRSDTFPGRGGMIGHVILMIDQLLAQVESKLSGRGIPPATISKPKTALSTVLALSLFGGIFYYYFMKRK